MPNPTIEQIKLPGSNQLYDIVDAGGRDLIAALSGSTKYLGVTTTPLTDGATTNPITVGGQSVTVTTGNIVIYGDAEFIWDGSKWDEFGDLSNLGHLAELDNVLISKGAGDMVLGEATTFTNASSSVTFSGGSSDTFVKSYPGSTSKLATTTVPNVTGNTDVTIPNVTGVGSASTWSFTMDGTTLVISGANSSVPTLGVALSASKVTLGTAKTVATGSLDANGGGDSVMTGLGTATTASAVTGIGTATAAAQTITVGTNDKVKVAKYDDIVGGSGAIINSNSAYTISINPQYTVHYTLSNPATLIAGSSEYYTEVHADSDYILVPNGSSVTMGSQTVSDALTFSSDCFTGYIRIPEVNGNIVITIRATDF